MGVMMQAFYWDCPRHEQKEHAWWAHLDSKLSELAGAGFTSLWLPPPSKAANIGGMSMGYDPYDYFDLGEHDQKGSVPTWFGTRAELQSLIATAHTLGLQVYADMVLNHNSGADTREPNPIDMQQRWTGFAPKSGRFARDWRSFHPSPYETFSDRAFGEFPDLCHRNPEVYIGLWQYARMLIEEVGFDGFRYDFVLGYGGWLVRALQETRYQRDGRQVLAFGVGECWEQSREIHDWLAETNIYSDNECRAFDFPLRYRLQRLCDEFGFDLRELGRDGVLLRERPDLAVTFVDNHDTAHSGQGVVHDKLLAYAFILSAEGYPCVFWQDYFTYGLGRPGQATGIAALVAAHERYAGGATTELWAERDLYIMQRDGHGAQPGLLLVLNNRGDGWHGARVKTRFNATTLRPVAWQAFGSDHAPHEQGTDADGYATLWAPPRGYVVYAPA